MKLRSRSFQEKIHDRDCAGEKRVHRWIGIGLTNRGYLELMVYQMEKSFHEFHYRNVLKYEQAGSASGTVPAKVDNTLTSN